MLWPNVFIITTHRWRCLTHVSVSVVWWAFEASTTDDASSSSYSAAVLIPLSVSDLGVDLTFLLWCNIRQRNDNNNYYFETTNFKIKSLISLFFILWYKRCIAYFTLHGRRRILIIISTITLKFLLWSCVMCVIVRMWNEPWCAFYSGDLILLKITSTTPPSVHLPAELNSDKVEMIWCSVVGIIAADDAALFCCDYCA